MPSKNQSGADNEQGSLADIAWLAGLLDGDGWVGIIRAKRSGKDYNRYTASLMMTSTSYRNAARTRQVLEDMGVNVYEREQPPWYGPDGSPRKRKWNISLRGNADTAIVLRKLIPHMTEKRYCAELVVQYVEWRESCPRSHGGRGVGSNAVGMRETADRFMELMSADRNRHDPSTTTRLAPSPIAEG